MIKRTIILRLFLIAFVVYGCLTSKIYALNDLQPIPYSVYDNSIELIVQSIGEIRDIQINSKAYKCGSFVVRRVVNSIQNNILSSDTISICIDDSLQSTKIYEYQCRFSFPKIEKDSTYHVYLTSKDSIFFLSWYEKNKYIKKHGLDVELLQRKEISSYYAAVRGFCYGIVHGEVIEDVGDSSYGDHVRKIRVKVSCIARGSLCYFKDTIDVLLIPECDKYYDKYYNEYYNEYYGKYSDVPIVKGSKYYFQVSVAESVGNCRVDYLYAPNEGEGIYVCLWYFWES